MQRLHAHNNACDRIMWAQEGNAHSSRTWSGRLCVWTVSLSGLRRLAHPRCCCCCHCWTDRAWQQRGWWPLHALSVPCDGGWHEHIRQCVPVCSACCCCAAAKACQLKLDAPVIPDDPGCPDMLLRLHAGLSCIDR